MELKGFSELSPNADGTCETMPPANNASTIKANVRPERIAIIQKSVI